MPELLRRVWQRRQSSPSQRGCTLAAQLGAASAAQPGSMQAACSAGRWPRPACLLCGCRPRLWGPTRPARGPSKSCCPGCPRGHRLILGSTGRPAPCCSASSARGGPGSVHQPLRLLTVLPCWPTFAAAGLLMQGNCPRLAHSMPTPCTPCIIRLCTSWLLSHRPICLLHGAAAKNGAGAGGADSSSMGASRRPHIHGEGRAARGSLGLV